MTTAMQLLGAVLGFDSDLNLKPAGLIVFATLVRVLAKVATSHL